jgi:hypothetical protein
MNNEKSIKFRDAYGPWAVVTGASEGIGRAFAQQVAAAGVNVVLVARRKALLDSFAAELQTTHQIEARPVALDLSRPTAWSELMHGTASLDVGLFVAAAGFGSAGRVLESDLASGLDMIEVNCAAVFALSQQFGQRFVTRGRGGIVLMSSLVAFQGAPFAANYAATKAYVQSLAEGLRAELSPHGVAVIASAPGPIHSGFAGRAHMKMGLAQTPALVARGTLRALGRRGTTRPGWLSKLLWYSMAVLPRAFRVQIMKQVMRGMALGLPALSRSRHPLAS